MADPEPKTIVITGASSGIGKATARLFLDKGWNVVATMRDPAAEKDLKEQARLKLVALDVQDPASPKAAVAEAIKAFGRIDVWLNNAGYGAFGPVEAGTREQIERQFDVNVFGLIACVQAVAPHFRANKAGVLINVSSIGGIMTVPAYSVYNATQVRGRGSVGRTVVRARDIRDQGQGDRARRDQDRFRRPLAGRLGHLRVPAYAPFMDKVNAARARYIRIRARPNSSPRSSTGRRPTRATACAISPAPTRAASFRCAACSAPGRTMRMIKQRFGL